MNSRPDELVTAALLRQQLILHLLARLGARAWLLISPFGWADSWALRVLVGIFMAYDLCQAAAIRTGRLSMRVRWLLDTADISFWAVLCPATAPYTAATVVAVPLMLVIPIAVGLRVAFGAAVAMTAAVGAARTVAGADAFLADTAMWLAIAIVLGVVLSRLVHAEVTRQQSAGHAVNQAELVAAALAGRNDVVTGVGRDAIDDLQSTIMRLSLARVDAAAELRKAVSLHKQELAEQTRADAVYLRDALDAYAAERRTEEPAVALHVFFDVDGADASRVLSRRQADQLTAELDAVGVHGEVPVRVQPSRPREPVVITAGGVQVVLAAIRRATVALPVAPVAIVGLALYTLAMSDSAYTGMPFSQTVPLAAGILVCAGVALLLIRRFGARAEPWVAVATLVPFLCVAAATRHADTGSGPAPFPLLGPFVAMALLLGTVVRPRMAVAAALTALIPAVAAVVWSGHHVTARHTISEFIWPFIAFLGAHLVGRAFARLSSELSEQFSLDTEAEARQQQQRARDAELRYLSDVLARGEALCRYAEHGPVRDAVVRDLRRIRTLLAAQKATP